jgi:hypothetical protein
VASKYIVRKYSEGIFLYIINPYGVFIYTIYPWKLSISDNSKWRLGTFEFKAGTSGLIVIKLPLTESKITSSLNSPFYHKRCHTTGSPRSNHLDLHSCGARFDSRPGHQHSCLSTFLIFLCPPGKCWDSTSIIPGPHPSKSSPFCQLSYHLMTKRVECRNISDSMLNIIFQKFILKSLWYN